MLDQKMAKKQEAQRKHICRPSSTASRPRPSKARQAQSRVKMLEKMAPIAAIVTSDVLPINIPAPDEAAVAADRRARRRGRRLRAGQAGAAGPDAADRQRRPHRAARRQRQRQVDAGEADRRPARAVRGHHHARLETQDRLFRAAPARRTRSRGHRLRPRARADARRAGGEGARAGRLHRLFRPRPPTPRSTSCRAARRRGCCSGLRRSADRTCSSSTSRPTISTSTAARR